jgi:hypothetical protein
VRARGFDLEQMILKKIAAKTFVLLLAHSLG